MKSAEETTTLERRLTWANEHWILFFSEMPLREKNFQSVTQTLQTKAKLHKYPMNLNADRHSQKMKLEAFSKSTLLPFRR